MHVIAFKPRLTAAGYSLIEVMITMFIIAIGLLGLAGLQARALNGEIEAASRGQGLLLANDMADRMAANLSSVKLPSGAATYDQQSGGAPIVFGTGYTNTCITSNPANLSDQATCCAAKSSQAEIDVCEWDLALKGIAESSGATKIGAMSGARGCVFLQAANVYEIDVAWQGRDATGAVASDLTCGATAITTRRRGVSRRLRVSDLDGS